MSWAFKFRKNVHMYSHELKCKKGNIEFHCQSEDSAQEENVILFWLDDVPLQKAKIDEFSSNLEGWCKQQGFRFRIYLGNNCLASFLNN